jgi:hypothetical protein
MSTAGKPSRIFTSPVSTDDILVLDAAVVPLKSSTIRSRVNVPESRKRVIETQLQRLACSGVIQSCPGERGKDHRGAVQRPEAEGREDVSLGTVGMRVGYGEDSEVSEERDHHGWEGGGRRDSYTDRVNAEEDDNVVEVVRPPPTHSAASLNTPLPAIVAVKEEEGDKAEASPPSPECTVCRSSCEGGLGLYFSRVHINEVARVAGRGSRGGSNQC